MEKIKIVVCDDIENLRKYITAAINVQDDMEVVGTASSGCEAVEIVHKTKPDVVLMDIQMEDEHAGITATEKITKECPNTKVVMLTIHGSDELIIDAYYAGAVDYIIKSTERDKLCNNIRRVYSESDLIGPLMTRAVKKEMLDMKIKKESFLFFVNSFSTLTPAERDILKLLYMGNSRKKIAEQKYLSIDTVHVHVKHILKKLKYTSTNQLLSFIKSIKLFEEFEL